MVQRLPRVLPAGVCEPERVAHSLAVERLLGNNVPVVASEACSSLLPPLAVLMDADHVFVVSAYSGHSLKRFIGRVSRDLAVDLLADAVRGLACAHKQVSVCSGMPHAALWQLMRVLSLHSVGHLAQRIMTPHHGRPFPQHCPHPFSPPDAFADPHCFPPRAALLQGLVHRSLSLHNLHLDLHGYTPQLRIGGWSRSVHMDEVQSGHLSMDHLSHRLRVYVAPELVTAGRAPASHLLQALRAATGPKVGDGVLHGLQLPVGAKAQAGPATGQDHPRTRVGCVAWYAQLTAPGGCSVTP